MASGTRATSRGSTGAATDRVRLDRVRFEGSVDGANRGVGVDKELTHLETLTERVRGARQAADRIGVDFARVADRVFGTPGADTDAGGEPDLPDSTIGRLGQAIDSLESSLGYLESQLKRLINL